ncbi:MAG: hypothetical protein IJY67_02990 [Paludibacteraceae bacterium]|nr:hypothetical protein [Paludibacteraceae bacterium]
MLNISEKSINKFLANQSIAKSKETIQVPSLTTWNNGKYGVFTTIEANKKGEIYRCKFDEFSYNYNEKDNVIEYKRLLEQNEEDMGRGFVVGFLKIRNMNNGPEILKKGLIEFYEEHNIPCEDLKVKIDTIDDVFKRYYEKVRVCNYQLFPEKDFKKVLLKDENEYFLYTKERLFPFFEEDGRRLLTIFTRGFFDYARKQGCVGEFVEDDVYKVDERLIKVDKILSAYKYEDKIDDYNIELIKDAIQHFIYDNRIEIGVDIAKLKKGENIDFTYYLMTSCFFAIYSENYNSADRERWCRLCGALFDKTQKTWNAHWNDNSKISREFMRKIESYYK